MPACHASGSAVWLFKIAEAEVWDGLDPSLPWTGSALDRQDGFVHLSEAHQVAGTLARHFPGRAGLRLLWLSSAALPEGALRFEESRGGMRFPHLYVPLEPAWVIRSDPLPLGVDGRHQLPVDLPVGR